MRVSRLSGRRTSPARYGSAARQVLAGSEPRRIKRTVSGTGPGSGSAGDVPSALSRVNTCRRRRRYRRSRDRARPARRAGTSPADPEPDEARPSGACRGGDPRSCRELLDLEPAQLERSPSHRRGCGRRRRAPGGDLPHDRLGVREIDRAVEMHLGSRHVLTPSPGHCASPSASTRGGCRASLMSRSCVRR